jgi:hypothetical protein
MCFPPEHGLGKSVPTDDFQLCGSRFRGDVADNSDTNVPHFLEEHHHMINKDEGKKLRVNCLGEKNFLSSQCNFVVIL